MLMGLNADIVWRQGLCIGEHRVLLCHSSHREATEQGEGGTAAQVQLEQGSSVCLQGGVLCTGQL